MFRPVGVERHFSKSQGVGAGGRYTRHGVRAAVNLLTACHSYGSAGCVTLATSVRCRIRRGNVGDDDVNAFVVAG